MQDIRTNLKERIILTMEVNGKWGKVQLGFTKHRLCHTNQKAFFEKITEFSFKCNAVGLTYWASVKDLMQSYMGLFKRKIMCCERVTV